MNPDTGATEPRINAVLTVIDDHRAELSGDLMNDTVVGVIAAGKARIAASQDYWILDMRGVKKVSSAGVALLLEWMRCAVAAKVTLHIENLPEHMRPIISVSDLEPLFEPMLAEISQ